MKWLLVKVVYRRRSLERDNRLVTSRVVALYGVFVVRVQKKKKKIRRWCWGGLMVVKTVWGLSCVAALFLNRALDESWSLRPSTSGNQRVVSCSCEWRERGGGDGVPPDLGESSVLSTLLSSRIQLSLSCCVRAMSTNNTFLLPTIWNDSFSVVLLGQPWHALKKKMMMSAVVR